MNNYYEDKWEALEREVDKKGGNGADVVSALKDFYSVYDDKTVEWLARLYDPSVGGFYYSNSGRDNEFTVLNGQKFRLLPDIESTKQAITFLKAHGIINEYSDIPEKMRDQMYNFISSCEDPDTGFFYHKQWSKELTDSRASRRGRDLMWAEDMARAFDWKYPYPTANERLSGVKNDDDAALNIPEYLRTKEKLIEYLDSFDFENRAYYSGNTLAAQVYPIRAAGLSEVVTDYFDAIQNKETGLWGNSVGYDAVNGHMKITCFYSFAGLPIPCAEKAIPTIIKILMSDEPAPHVCCQYNCWFSIQNILESLRKFGGDEGNKKADEIIASLLKIAPEAIRASKEKVLTFRKEDYSFSYTPSHTADQSQGVPVAVYGTNEGDVNATGICSNGIIGRLYAALGLREFYVPVFSPRAYSKFLDILRLD